MEIEEFFEIYQNAAWNKDTKSMINLYSEQCVIFDMWDQGYNSNSSEWNKIIIDWLGSLEEEKVKVNFEMVKIHKSDNVGFATALIQFQAISNEGVVIRKYEE